MPDLWSTIRVQLCPTNARTGIVAAAYGFFIGTMASYILFDQTGFSFTLCACMALAYLILSRQQALLDLVGIALVMIGLLSLILTVELLIVPVLINGRALGLGVGYVGRVLFVTLTIVVMLVCIGMGAYLFRGE